MNVQPNSCPRQVWTLKTNLNADQDVEICIPRLEKFLKQSFFDAAHTRIIGHKSKVTTLGDFRGGLWLQDIRRCVKHFSTSCLQCISSDSGQMVPRPLVPANKLKILKLINFYYLYIGKSTRPYKYVLVINDTLTSYIKLIFVTDIDSIIAADCS